MRYAVELILLIVTAICMAWAATRQRIDMAFIGFFAFVIEEIIRTWPVHW